MQFLQITLALVGLAALLAFIIKYSGLRKKLAVKNSNNDNPQTNFLNSSQILLPSIPGFFCLKDAEDRWLQVSQQYADLFGLNASDCIGKPDGEIIKLAGNYQAALMQAIDQDRQAWELGTPVTNKAAFPPEKDGGGDATADITRTPFYHDNGGRFRLLLTAGCLPPQQSIAQGLYASFFYQSQLPLLLLDADLKVLDSNDAYTSFTGYSKQESLNNSVAFLDKNKPNPEFASTIKVWLNKNRTEAWAGEILCHAKGGEIFPIKLLISPIESSEDKAIYYSVCLLDISKQKEGEYKIRNIAHHDELTSLPNRAYFIDRLERTIAQATRRKQHFAVFFISLDRFKIINDSLGRPAGDELLKQVGDRLAFLANKGELLARLGGDEFVILCPNEETHEKAIYSSSILAQNILARLRETFYFRIHEIFIGASIGIAIFPEDADTSELLLRNADLAMMEAKKLGGNGFQFFQAKHTSTAKHKHQIEVGLRKALQRQHFLLYYQPQFHARNREIHGAEVLLRWQQDGTKMVPPYQFIDIAEETGLIVQIGKWILETACKQQKAWLETGYPINQVSVNVSAKQFLDPNFIEAVENALVKSGLSPLHLELEITESLLMGDVKKVELQLNRLKKMGIKIALDDFGTGYSSLSYLKNFPIDVVKIDQSFVRGMAPESKDGKIVRAIIEMGHSLGYLVVAEGVENEEQLALLNNKGCDIIQGYLFSKPLPTAEMTRLLENHAIQ